MPDAGSDPTHRVRGAALGWILLVGIGVGIVLMGTGMVATQSAQVEDDPDYCASCHLVEATLDSLAAGGHDEMSCLECHSTTFADQASFGLATIVGAELPAGHATFANRTSCASCHEGEDASSELRVEGIAAHEAHLFSDDPEVAAMACTSCHVVDDHGFTPTTAGCSASGCHSDMSVRLGGMSHEPLDCGDCHQLPDTVLPSDSTALSPGAAQCLSCHDMAAALPDQGMAGEPHGSECSWCHKPHTHTLAAEAAGTCASAGCHTEPESLVAAHRGLAPGVLEGCSGCHAPHQAHVEQQDCTACHDASGGLLPGVTGPPPPGTPGSGIQLRPSNRGGELLSRQPAAALDDPTLDDPAVGGLSGGMGGGVGGVRAVPRVVLEILADRAAAMMHAAPDTVLPARFIHEEHTTNDCAACHAPNGTEHGQLIVQTAADCRSCHHLADDAPTCETCHDSAEPGGSGIVRTMQLDLSVLDVLAYRDVPFTHAGHTSEDCATCHLPSLTRTSEAEDCQGCHVEHHEAEVTCATCHIEAPIEEHPINQVHLGCGGAGCHTGVPAPIDDRQRDRATCLSCHSAVQEAHYEEEETSCVACHALPPAHSGGGR